MAVVSFLEEEQKDGMVLEGEGKLDDARNDDARFSADGANIYVRTRTETASEKTIGDRAPKVEKCSLSLSLE